MKVVVAVPNSPYGLCGRKATLNSNSRVSVVRTCVKVEVAVLSSPSLIYSPYGLCGRKATLNLKLSSELRSCVKVEVAVEGSILVPNSPYGLCGRKATLD